MSNKSMTKTFETSTPQPLVYWYDSPETQIERLLDLSRQLGLGITFSDIPPIPKYRVLRDSNAKLTLLYYFKNGKGGVYFDTLTTLAAHLISIGVLELGLSEKITISDIQPLYGIQYEVAIRWAFVDLASNIDRSVCQIVLATRREDRANLVSIIEYLMVLINFPRLFTALQRGEMPLPNLAGCHVWERAMHLGMSSNKLVLRDDDKRAHGSSWAVPTIVKQ